MKASTTSSQVRGINIPSQKTLARHGWTVKEWLELLKSQDYCCGVCKEKPPSGRLVIDHEHIPGWKYLLPAERRPYVRGLACTTCNHFVLTRYGTPAKFRGAAEFLERYYARSKDEETACSPYCRGCISCSDSSTSSTRDAV